MELFTLHNQWATRPDDQRFTTLQQVLDVTTASAKASREKTVPWADLRVEAVGDDISLVGKANVPAMLTHYAFGQLSARVGAPTSYMRKLPATLAAQNLNHGLKNRIDTGNDASLLIHVGDMSDGAVFPRMALRSVLTEKYSRLWNAEVVMRLMDFADSNGLVPVRPTFSWDGQPVKDSEAALYASDHDMVLGLMTPERSVYDGKSDLFRILIVENSEVGDRSFRVTFAYVRDVCSNFILWGSPESMEFSFPHIGDVQSKWGNIKMDIKHYLDKSTDEEQRMIVTAQSTRLGVNKEELLDAIFGMRSVGLSKRAIGDAYDMVNVDQDGDPNSVWGFVQGLTRYSQSEHGTHADKRLELDRAGRKILQTLDF